MKIILSVLLLSTTSLSSAFANTFTFDSKIDRVTVFPRGAEVTRIAKGKIEAGSHVIIVENMPENIDPNSLRVEGKAGSALTIGSVDMRKVTVESKDNSSEKRVLEDKIEGANDEINALQKSLENDDMQRQLLQSLVVNSTASVGENKNVLSAEALDSILTTTAKRMKAMTDRAVKTGTRLRGLKREIVKLRKKINRLAPSDEINTIVEINLNSSATSDAEFSIKYAVHNAGWLPVYDANLSLDNPSAETTMQITRKANVYQKTTESWQNVKLKLSTARLSNATDAPDLNAWELDELRREYRKTKRLMRSPVGNYNNEKMESSISDLNETVGGLAEAPIAAMPAPVDISFSGFQAEYKISGLTTISNELRTKSVTISKNILPVVLSAVSVPHKDPTAYLIANFKLDSQVSFLPGAVFLSRDGAYIGKGHLPLLTPGEGFSLGFGQDDLVKIEYTEVDKKKGEAGFISTVKLDERSFLTTIDYRHDFPMEVKILDRIPVSNHEDITVTLNSGVTNPTEKNVDDKRGVLAWTQKMNSGEIAKIDFGYTISWPETMKLSHIN